MFQKLAWSSIQFVRHAENFLFPFYNPRHKALTGPKLTSSKNLDTLQGLG